MIIPLKKIISLVLILSFVWLVCEAYAKGKSPRGMGESFEIARVSRHNIIHKVPPPHPLFTGNGTLGMSIDASGTQCFKADYAVNTISTIAQNLWFDPPLPKSLQHVRLSTQSYPHREGHTLAYPYASTPEEQKLYDWLRRHPNKFNVADIQLGLATGGRELSSPKELTDFRQRLDLYNGVIKTRYRWKGVTTAIESFIHARKNLIVFHINDSASVPVARTLTITVGDPVGFDARYEKGPPQSDSATAAERKRPLMQTGKSDDHQRFWALRPLPNGFSHAFVGGATAAVQAVRFSEQTITVELAPYREKEFTVFLFIVSEQEHSEPIRSGKEFIEATIRQDYQAVLSEHQQWWHDYWGRSSIELDSYRGERSRTVHGERSRTIDDRGEKLERWYYLSLYHLACSDRGTLPPAEGGLVANSWYGKFHLEMHFWHAIGFLAANRPECLRPSLQWYLDVLPQAKKNAEAMGLKGAKYPKMTSFRGLDCPGRTNLRIYWHVGEIPTLIYWYYLHTLDRAFLEEMYPVLQETADFVVSFLVENPATGKYELLPPVATCDETTNPDSVKNPGFTLAEFKLALTIAVKAAQLLGRDEKNIGRWSQVRDNIAQIPHNGKAYLIYEGFTQSWTPRHTRSHPSVLGPFFPTFVVPDDSLIRNTYDKVLGLWNWDQVWGWDFGFAAAVGAWLGRAEDAIDCLLKAETQMSPQVTFSGGGVKSYLPGNGGIVLGLNEMLLRSLDGTIRLFSGIPPFWHAKFQDLRAVGGFLVSAEKQAEAIGPISIKSSAARICRLEVPNGWTLEDVEIKSKGRLIKKRKISQQILEFDTQAGSTYTITPQHSR